MVLRLLEGRLMALEGLDRWPWLLVAEIGLEGHLPPGYLLHPRGD